MTFEEYVQYREMDARTEGKIEGKIEGKVEATMEAVIEILNKYGEDIPDEFIAKIKAETEYKVLKSWLRAAVESNSIAEFRRLANI